MPVSYAGSDAQPPLRTVLHDGGGVVVQTYRCRAGRRARPFAEVHTAHSLSFVRAGSFGCRCGTGRFELVPGSMLVGRPGAGYECSHEHGDGGDECLSFHFAPDLAAEVGDDAAWGAGALPAPPQLWLRAASALAAAEARSEIAPEEAALALAASFVALRHTGVSQQRNPSAAERARIVEAAVWLDAHSADAVDLRGAAAFAGMTRFHFLRRFAQLVGVTPHQYLLRSRLRRAGQQLADTSLPVTTVAFDAGFGDLSNFVRTFARVAGQPPARWRAAARAKGAQFPPRLRGTTAGT